MLVLFCFTAIFHDCLLEFHNNVQFSRVMWVPCYRKLKQSTRLHSNKDSTVHLHVYDFLASYADIVSARHALLPKQCLWRGLIPDFRAVSILIGYHQDATRNSQKCLAIQRIKKENFYGNEFIDDQFSNCYCTNCLHVHTRIGISLSLR